LAEVGELDRIAVGDVDGAVEVAESYELALGIVVSGDVGVAKEREERLEGWIALLGGADVAEKHGLVGDGSGHGSELELVRAEQCAGWRIGRLAPLREVMASRHGVWLTHGLARAVGLEVGKDGGCGKRGLELLEGSALLGLGKQAVVAEALGHEAGLARVLVAGRAVDEGVVVVVERYCRSGILTGDGRGLWLWVRRLWGCR